MKNTKPTHAILFKREGGHEFKQHAFGKSDLFRCLRDMMNDGYTEFTIITIAKAKGETK